MKGLQQHWYARSPWLLLLTPLSVVFHAVVLLRRLAYRYGILRSGHPGVPVVVVGNITAGGTGKTPLVAWLVNDLKAGGWRPGIVSRGYRGKASSWPQQVRADSDPVTVGDEAVMLAGQCRCPMAVGPDRLAAARALVDHGDCNIILSDDGLQHYALDRDIEIAVIDGIRRFGNGFLMPAGPLREPEKRLRSVDLVVVNGLGKHGEYPMKLKPGQAVPLEGGLSAAALADFRGKRVHAVAGIGNPERFFQVLGQAGIQAETHAFSDHHPFRREELEFGDDLPVFMTEKDAVKCRGMGLKDAWYVPVAAELPKGFRENFYALLDGCARQQSEGENADG